MFKKKSSSVKVMESLINEAYELRHQNNFDLSITKFEEAINLIQSEFKDLEFIEDQVSKLEMEIIALYSDKINNIILQAKELMKQDQLEEANTRLYDALEVAKNIKNDEIKDNFIRNIENLVNLNKFRLVLDKASKFLEQNELEEVKSLLKETKIQVEEVADSETKRDILNQIQELVDHTYQAKIDEISITANALVGESKKDEALKLLKENFSSLDELIGSSRKEEFSLKLKKKINEIHALQIESIINKSQPFLDQGSLIDLTQSLKETKEIIDSMEETEQKQRQIQKANKIFYPVFEKEINNLFQKGMEIIKNEDFEKSTKMVSDAIQYFVNALDLANKLVDSDLKEKLITRIQVELNQTCSKGINTRKEKANEMVQNKNFEEAIGDIYSALSIAKSVAYGDEESQQTEELKNFINNIYSAQIEDLIENAKIKLNQDTFEEARGLLNSALSVTNKMYLSRQMDDEIEKINKMMRRIEINETISKGDILLESEKFNKELEELREKLESAEAIEDSDEKYQELQNIKNLIDNVHASEITLIIEQTFQHIKSENYEGAMQEIDQTLSIVQKIELEENKKKELVEILKKILEISTILSSKEVYKVVPDLFDKAFEIIQLMTEQELKGHSLIELIDLMSSFGQKLFAQDKGENAIKDLKAALVFCKEFEDEQIKTDLSEKVEGILKNGMINIAKQLMIIKEYDKVIEISKDLISIDDNFIQAHDYLANAYMRRKKYDLAIPSYERVIKSNPDNFKALIRIGLIHELKDHIPEALEYYKRASAIDFMKFLRQNRELYSELTSNQNEK